MSKMSFKLAKALESGRAKASMPKSREHIGQAAS
jgi:hypothetical protein